MKLEQEARDEWTSRFGEIDSDKIFLAQRCGRAKKQSTKIKLGLRVLPTHHPWLLVVCRYRKHAKNRRAAAAIPSSEAAAASSSFCPPAAAATPATAVAHRGSDQPTRADRLQLIDRAAAFLRAHVAGIVSAPDLVKKAWTLELLDQLRQTQQEGSTRHKECRSPEMHVRT
jgi:hypothetical protein